MAMDAGTDPLSDLIGRWDRMLEVYAPRREQCFDAVLRLLEQRVATARLGRAPRVLDLGSGTGTFGVRLLDRMPRARYLGVDRDPVMCRLAEVVGDPYGDRFTVAHADLSEVPWWSSPTASITDPLDLVITSATLHYLPEVMIRRVLRAVTTHLRPGGLLAVADRMAPDVPDGPDASVVNGGVGGVDPSGQRDDWRSWWAAARATPGLADAFARRDAHPSSSSEGEGPPHTVARYVAALEAAGLQDVRTIWQWFDDRVIVGMMPGA